MAVPKSSGVSGVAGSAMGVTAGSVASWWLDRYRMIPLNPDVYYLTHLPFSTRPSDLVYVGVAALLISLLATIYPALKAGAGHVGAPWWLEGVLLDVEDHVVETISANIFLVFGGRLLTPRLDRCGVRGVVRGQILSAFAPRCEQRHFKTVA